MYHVSLNFYYALNKLALHEFTTNELMKKGNLPFRLQASDSDVQISDINIKSGCKTSCERANNIQY